MRLTLPAKLLSFLTALLLSQCTIPCRADQFLLVNGQTSQNAIRFDLTTGASSLYAQYNFGAAPRNLARDAYGNIYSSLNGGAMNIVKFVSQPGTNVLATTDFTATVHRDGPGQIQFYNGVLYAAGDESRVIYQYNGETGVQIGQFAAPNSGNIRAMAISGSTLYYEEIFQNTAHAFDLTQNPPTGSTLFQNSPNLARASNMTVGPLGNLVFANANSPLLQEYDSQTGAFLGTLADVSTFDSSLTGSWDVLYSPVLQNYFVSAKNEVFRLDVHGVLLQTYTSSLLTAATGLLIVPEPSSFALAALSGAALFIVKRWPWRIRRLRIA